MKQLRAEGAEKVFREAASGAVTSLAFMVGHNFQAMMAETCWKGNNASGAKFGSFRLYFRYLRSN